MVVSKLTIKRRRFTELGLCIDCGTQSTQASGWKYCEKCYKRILAYRLKRKLLRSDRIKLGVCRDCGTENAPKGINVKLCEPCYAERKERGKRYKKINGISVQGNYNRRMRLKALQIVAGSEQPRCKKCDCTIINLLEINHLNHDGKIDYKPNGKLRAWEFYRNIVRGDRSVDDLNVLCKVCNIAYFASNKFNIGEWKISFVPTILK